MHIVRYDIWFHFSFCTENMWHFHREAVVALFPGPRPARIRPPEEDDVDALGAVRVRLSERRAGGDHGAIGATDYQGAAARPGTTIEDDGTMAMAMLWYFF